MASDDLKRFLLDQTGVPMARWKRLTRNTGLDGAVLRMFEDRDTGRRVLTRETDGAWSVLADTAQDGADGSLTGADAGAGHASPTLPEGTPMPAGAPVRRFAIVLAEDPSFDDALEYLPELDLSYRWFTTLRLDGAHGRSSRSALLALRAALPDYEVVAPGEDAGLMVFDDLYFVQKVEPSTGACTCEADRLDVVQRLQAHGWTFDPTLATDHAYGVGRPVPEQPVGPIVAWLPGMQLPTPEGEDPGWQARAQTFIDAIPDATEAELRHRLQEEQTPILREMLMALLTMHGAMRSIPGLGTAPPGATPGSIEPDPITPRSRFSFAFGENAELQDSDWQREWLEIYDAEDGGFDQHITEPMEAAGIALPVGLSEAVEGIFDYKLGEPAWDRRELARVLLALGLTWDRDECVLAATGFDPDQHPPAPWWRP